MDTPVVAVGRKETMSKTGTSRSRERLISDAIADTNKMIDHSHGRNNQTESESGGIENQVQTEAPSISSPARSSPKSDHFHLFIHLRSLIISKLD